MGFIESTLAYGGGNAMLMIVILFYLLLALFGYVIGSFLAKRVKGKHMIVGSALYWTVHLSNYYFHIRQGSSGEFLYQNRITDLLLSILFYWGLVVLPINVTYLAKHIVGRLKHSDVQK